MSPPETGPEQNSGMPCANLLVGVTGSVGAIAVPQYLFFLRQTFAREIHVLMSRAAQRFLLPYALRQVTGQPVMTDTFQTMPGINVPHVHLTRRADLFLILPATANVIGKAANGICDDPITTCIVACPAPVVFVPSMNEVMWSNKAVQRNLQTLRGLGYHVLEPSLGFEISNMKESYGAMPTFDRLLAKLKEIMPGRKMQPELNDAVFRPM